MPEACLADSCAGAIAAAIAMNVTRRRPRWRASRPPRCRARVGHERGGEAGQHRPGTTVAARALPRDTASAASAPVMIPASTMGSTDDPSALPAFGVVTTSSTAAFCSAAACASSWATIGLAADPVSTFGSRTRWPRTRRRPRDPRSHGGRSPRRNIASRRRRLPASPASPRLRQLPRAGPATPTGRSRGSSRELGQANTVSTRATTSGMTRMAAAGGLWRFMGSPPLRLGLRWRGRPRSGAAASSAASSLVASTDHQIACPPKAHEASVAPVAQRAVVAPEGSENDAALAAARGGAG